MKHARKDCRLFVDSLLVHTLQREHGWALMSHPLRDNFCGKCRWARELGFPSTLTEDAQRLVSSLIGSEPIAWGVLRVVDPERTRFIIVGRVGVKNHPLPVWLVSNIQTVLEVSDD
jgi:hypothetical protein